MTYVHEVCLAWLLHHLCQETIEVEIMDAVRNKVSANEVGGTDCQVVKGASCQSQSPGANPSERDCPLPKTGSAIGSGHGQILRAGREAGNPRHRA